MQVQPRGPRAHGTMTTGAAIAVHGHPDELVAHSIIAGLYQVGRALAAQDPTSRQAMQAVATLQHDLTRAHEHFRTQHLLVRLHNGDLWVQHVPVRGDAADTARAEWLVNRLQNAGFARLIFVHGIPSDDLFELGMVLSGAASSFSLQRLEREHLVAGPAVWDAAFDETLTEVTGLRRWPWLRLYAESMAVAVEAVTRPDLRDGTALHAYRTAWRWILAAREDAAALLGLLQLRPVAGHPANRRLDAAILATLLGQRLGLTDAQAAELGRTALLYDEPANRAPWWEHQPVTPQAAATFATRSARDALEWIVTSERLAPVGAILPDEWYGRGDYKHISTQIVEVASCFIDLLQPGPSTYPFAPDLAVQAIAAQAGQLFDMGIVAALVHLLGFYPPGSLVQLNSQDQAVVIQPPGPGRDLARPTVRLLNPLDDRLYDLHDPALAAYYIEGCPARAVDGRNPLHFFLR